ncbi:hypothetical protein AB6A40_006323 [Gnathostoma spinigerum]|uniref:Uncharacterized protein n=1 Tax=Gnathostoma spinigerum TaxID=75299 RepID=A0ABD6EN98_9BILA
MPWNSHREHPQRNSWKEESDTAGIHRDISTIRPDSSEDDYPASLRSVYEEGSKASNANLAYKEDSASVELRSRCLPALATHPSLQSPGNELARHPMVTRPQTPSQNYDQDDDYLLSLRDAWDQPDEGKRREDIDERQRNAEPYQQASVYVSQREGPEKKVPKIEPLPVMSSAEDIIQSKTNECIDVLTSLSELAKLTSEMEGEHVVNYSGLKKSDSAQVFDPRRSGSHSAPPNIRTEQEVDNGSSSSRLPVTRNVEENDLFDDLGSLTAEYNAANI